MQQNTAVFLFLIILQFQNRNMATVNTTKGTRRNSTCPSSSTGHCRLDIRVPEYRKMCPDNRKQMYRQNVLITKLIKAQEAFMSDMDTLLKQANERNTEIREIGNTKTENTNQQKLPREDKNGGILVATLHVEETKDNEKLEQLKTNLEYLTKQMNKQNEVLNKMILERSKYEIKLENMKMQMYDSLSDFKALQGKVDTIQSLMSFQYKSQDSVAALRHFRETFYADEQYALPVADPGSVVFECTFEKDLCGCAQDADDDFDWTRHSKETTTRMTGPLHDHTTRGMGYYMYIETSPPLKPGDKARLTTPPMAMSNDGYCVQFYYHMYGYSTGTLSVYVNTGKDGKMTKTPVWTRTGNQGNTWHKAQVRLVAVDKVQVTFEGVRGFTGLGDIALDDILIRNGKCI